MKDRTSKYPGRVKLVPVDGMENTYTMSWADEPAQEGTPLNKATFLPDTLAETMGLTQDDPVVADALRKIYDRFDGYAKLHITNGAPTTSDIDAAGTIWINTGGIPYFLYISMGVGVWVGVPVVGKTLKTEVFTSSTTWTRPAGVGAARVMVYGAGGGGGANSTYDGGGGGGGGRMATWEGVLSGSSYAITIGAGGAGGTYGGAGGSTSFGSLVSAAGGSGASGRTGGSGGSGGGGSCRYSAAGGTGYDFGGGSGSGNGSGKTNPGTTEKGGDGINTNGLSDIPAQGKGVGTGGKTALRSGTYYSGGGGGGYGGMGGNGDSGGGGGGGYGSAGNGGDGSSGQKGKDGGIGAGGGGGYYSDGGAGGPGICVIQYYT